MFGKFRRTHPVQNRTFCLPCSDRPPQPLHGPPIDSFSPLQQHGFVVSDPKQPAAELCRLDRVPSLQSPGKDCLLYFLCEFLIPQQPNQEGSDPSSMLLIEPFDRLWVDSICTRTGQKWVSPNNPGERCAVVGGYSLVSKETQELASRGWLGKHSTPIAPIRLRGGREFLRFRIPGIDGGQQSGYLFRFAFLRGRTEIGTRFTVSCRNRW